MVQLLQTEANQKASPSYRKITCRHELFDILLKYSWSEATRSNLGLLENVGVVPEVKIRIWSQVGVLLFGFLFWSHFFFVSEEKLHKQWMLQSGLFFVSTHSL